MPDPLSPGPDLAKVYGEDTRCPSCGAFAKSNPDGDLRWVCGVCGAPRVDLPKPPEETLVAIREAVQAQRTAAFQRLVQWGFGVPAGLTLLLAIMLAPASLVLGGVLVGIGVLLAIFSARGARRASTERKRLRGAVERAWEAAILDLAGQDKTVREIATLLRIAEGDVEAALAIRGVPAPVRVATETRVAASEPLEPASEPDAAARERR
jgi:hypothetical protein